MVVTILLGRFVVDQMWYTLECSVSLIELFYNMINKCIFVFIYSSVQSIRSRE